jgi:hypothetical protein
LFTLELRIEAIGQLRQHGGEILKRRTICAARDAGDVEWRQLVPSESERFTEHAFPSVARDRGADLTRDDEAQAGMTQAVGDAAKPNCAIRNGAPRVEHATIVCRLEQSQAFWELVFGGHGAIVARR